MTKKGTLSAWPRLMKANEAARYIGTSPTTLRSLVDQGMVSQPLERGGERLWDIRDLDDHAESLSRAGEPNASDWTGQAI